MPVIHALPRIAGTIARRPPTVVSDTTRPSKIEPITEACCIVSPACIRPRACSTAIRAERPVPVADNVINLAITYDVCDGTNGPGCAGIGNPLAAPFSPNQVHKVNIQVMAQTLSSYGNQSRSTVLSTSVSTRSMSFTDRYQ